MNKKLAALPLGIVALVATLALAGCGAKTPRGVFSHGNGPNEFVVGRAQPLVVPPDFALVPPKPGAPRPQEADSSAQALNALYGGRAQASAGEQALIQSAGGQPESGIRSTATGGAAVVNKGAQTRDIVSAPASSNPQAQAATTPAGTTPAPKQ